MTPVSARPVDEPQKVNRNVFCKNYDVCLDLAISRGWQNFTCEMCASFSAMQKMPAQWRQDGLRCAAVIAVLWGLMVMPEDDSL